MKNIIDFIKDSTDCWHTAAEVSAVLDSAGFERLGEGDERKLKNGGRYYVVRNMSSVIAFKTPSDKPERYMIAAAHGESPSFKIKAVPELADKNYIKLNVEAYGGMSLPSWLDRPLSVSGRVVIDNGESLNVRLVNIDRDSLIIPSLAIHLGRGSKNSAELNICRDMPPMYALSESEAGIMSEIADVLGEEEKSIIGCDLMLYNRERGRIWGRNNEFISAPRLDDLQCVYALLKGFIESGESRDTVQTLCIFDNEEVGSGTKQGAKSDFLSSVLLRISNCFGIDYAGHMRRLNSSFLVSADNAHAIHPNRSDAYDSENYPRIGGGVVIKYNAAQRYTTDAVSEAIFKKICRRAGVPYQVYANKSDIAGGSTLGNLAAEKTCVSSVDIGLAQLAMHSAYETAGNADTSYMANAVREFYNTRLCVINDEIRI